MSEARIPYGKKKARKVPSPRAEALKDALPDVQPPARKKRIRLLDEPVAESDEDDD